MNNSRLWIWGYLKYSVPKFGTSLCHVNLPKMNVFFHLLGGGGGGGGLKFCLCGYQTSIIHVCRQIFHILMVEELFLSNQGNSYVMSN